MTEQNEPNKEAVRRGKSVFLRIVIGFLLVITGVVAFLPSILSLDVIKGAVVGKINSAGNGKLAIHSWSFTWFSGISAKDLAFEDKQGMHIKIEQVKTSRGLAGLIGRTIDMGTLVVSSPEILSVIEQQQTLGKGASISSEVKPGQGDQKKLVPQGKPARRPPSTAKVSGPVQVPVDVIGTIKVENGKMSIRVNGTNQKYDFEKINCVLGISSLNKPVNIEAGLSQVGGGAFRLSGSVKLMESGVLDPAKIGSDVTVEIAALDLEPIAVLLSAAGNIPSVKGSLDTKFKIKVDGVNKITADGSISLSNLLLSGGPLGTDKPNIDSSKFDFSVLIDGKNISIRSFSINLPFMTATAGGELADKGLKYPVGTVSFSAKLDIPKLASLLPDTLKLEKGLTISKGEVSAKAEVKSEGNDLSCEVDVSLAGVEARSAENVMTLSHPILLNSKVVMTSGNVRIDKCRLSSSFVNMNGHGDLKDLQVTLNADLSAAMDELRKFVAMGKVSAAGKLSAVSRIQNVSASERKATTRVILDELKVSGIAPSPLVLESARAGLDVILKAAPEGRITEMRDLRMTVESAPLSGKVDIARVVTAGKPEEMGMDGIMVKAHSDIKKLFSLCRGMGLLPPDTDGSGVVYADMTGKMEKGSLSIGPVSLSAMNFVYSSNKKKFSEPEATARFLLESDVTGRNLKISGLDVKFSSGTINIPSLKVLKRDGSVPEISTAGSVALDLARMSVQAADFLQMQAGTSLSGSFNSKFSSVPAGKMQSVDLEAGIKNFKVQPAKGPAVVEPALRFALNSEVDNVAGDVAIKNVKLDSSIIALSAEGSLKDIRNQKLLLLDGRQTVDFKRIGELVTAFSGKAIVMEGCKESRFHVRISLTESGWKKILRNTDLAAGLYVSKIKAFGLQVEGLDFNAAAAKGLVRTDISTKVNEGDLKIGPEVNAVVDNVFLSVADGSQVLRNVRITQDMMSDMLGKVNPVLKGCIVTSGLADLVLKKCYVPLDSSQKDKIFVEGEFVLRNMVLEPGGLLKAVLDVCKLETKSVTLSNEVFSFVCRNGRIEPSPLTIGNNDYNITFSGYMTLDGMVKYVAQVPITERMIGKDAFKYMSKLTVKVPIEGPVDKPVISGEAIRAAISDLTKDAAKEAATTAIMEEGGKLLNDLFNKKKKAPQGNTPKK